MSFGLDEENITRICAVFRRFPAVELVLIYGSRAMGNYRNGSDIDLCFWGDDLDSFTMHQIADMLDDLPMLYSFDLVRHSEIGNPDLDCHIQRVGKVFYQKNPQLSPQAV